MDNLETPYEEEEAGFIECTVCDKSIRGETLYKIHVTTPGHIKKEAALVAEGADVGQHSVPAFKDILHYLDYLKLDEPIIGLRYLEEQPFSGQLGGPNYLCKICHMTANLPETVHHLIGRKHRQKYVELRRPDLVTWDKQSIMTQGGKIIRTRAEIIERQDGRGSPVLLPKRAFESKSNISRAPQRQKQMRDQRIPQRAPRDVPPLLPGLKNYQADNSYRNKYSPSFSNTPSFHSDEPYMNRDRLRQREDTLSHDRFKGDLRRADYRDSRMCRQDYMDSDYSSQREEEYVGDLQRRGRLEPDDAPRYDYREEPPRRRVEHVENYPGEAPSFKRPYPERDPLKEFYSEEVRRGQVRSAEYQASQLAYPEGDKQWWSLESESGRHDSMNRAGRQGSSEPEAKRRNFSTPIESDRSRDHLFHIIRDYHHEMREPHQEEAFDNPGPSRAGVPTSQRQVQVTRKVTDIPEPFRRFLKGADDVEEQGKRKRKSRFSDATPKELEMTRMLCDEYGPPNPAFAGDPRPGSAPLRPEVSGTLHSDLYSESQSPYIESYQREAPESEGVFDVLKNIEIENTEEADFLKSKLCSLLKEFKTKKSEKAAQNCQGRAGISKNYNDLNLDPELPGRHQYKRTLREDSDHRQPEDVYFRDDHRRGWKQQEHMPEERHQEYHPPARQEPRLTNRSSYEEVFGTPHTNILDEPSSYPERFQEPKRPRDYRPAVDEFFDSHSSAPSLHMEQGPRMNRGPRYSNNLDKITSTLLELVARK